MKNILVLLFTIFLVPAAFADSDSANTVKLELTPAAALEAGKPAHVTAKLTYIKDSKPLTLTDLKVAHTKKLHLLVIDPSLTDYHHVHPTPGKEPGTFVFNFTPLKSGPYRAWADIIPTRSDKQEYVIADMGPPAKEKPTIDKKLSTQVTVDGYDFMLLLDGPAKAGEAVMGHLSVSQDGKPFLNLEPVMGAYAHIVGFSDDYHSIMHIHPMGEEPTKASDRGGPVLDFHMMPEKKGFVKLFAQVRIEGKDVFAPFGVMVK